MSKLPNPIDNLHRKEKKYIIHRMVREIDLKWLIKRLEESFEWEEGIFEDSEENIKTLEQIKERYEL